MPARPRKEAPAPPRRRLRDFLTKEQWDTHLRYCYFDVVGSRGREYRIQTNVTSGNITRLTDIRGRPLKYPTRWCAGPTDIGPEGLSDGLFWVVQKLLIEQDEDYFFEEALRA